MKKYQGKVQTKSKSDVRIRIVTSVLVIALIVPFLFFASYPDLYNFGYQMFFDSVLIIAATYGTFEIINSMIKDIKSKEFLITFYVALSMVALIAASMFMNDLGMQLEMWALSASLAIAFVGLIAVMSILDIEWKHIGVIAITAILLSFFFVALHYTAVNFGWSVLFWLMLIVISTDTLAYFGGKKFGKRKPFPNISPNKTTEGLVIGVTSGFVLGVAWYFGLIYPESISGVNMEIWVGIVFSFVAAVIAPMGDLFFSKIKREIGVKDFSSLLPGHGGLLDRIDSHIFVMTSMTIFLALVI